MESELLDIEIAKVQSEINDTAIGISLLGTFFLTIIPVFYGMMGIYNLAFESIQFPLITAVGIVFITTMLAVLHWEQNTEKLKKLQAQKVEIVSNKYKKEEITPEVHDRHKKKR
jgi:uncharacterized membrane protein